MPNDFNTLVAKITNQVTDEERLLHEYLCTSLGDDYLEHYTVVEVNEVDYFEHHGVKGMKWGVRKRSKTRVSSSGARSTSPNPSSKVSAPTTRDKRVKALKNRRELSDSDIKDFTSRLQSEKQLKALLDEDVSPGRTFIKKVMSDAGKQAATKLATNAIIYGTTKTMGKAFGSELEKALSGKKKD